MIRPANERDKDNILSLYRAQIGKPFCPWNEDYPTMREIDYDLGRNALFVKENEDGQIIAAISLDLDDNVETLDCWSEDRMPGGEVSRLVVRESEQNQGIACEMLLFAQKELKERGYKSIHYLVDRNNEKALRSYRRFNADQVGTCRLYEHEFFCFEKELP